MRIRSITIAPGELTYHRIIFIFSTCDGARSFKGISHKEITTAPSLHVKNRGGVNREVNLTVKSFCISHIVMESWWQPQNKSQTDKLCLSSVIHSLWNIMKSNGKPRNTRQRLCLMHILNQSYLEITLFSLNQFLMFCLTTHVFQMTEKTKKKLQKYIKKCGKGN